MFMFQKILSTNICLLYENKKAISIKIHQFATAIAMLCHYRYYDTVDKSRELRRYCLGNIGDT